MPAELWHMKIITGAGDGNYLLGQLDRPSHDAGRLPAGPGRHGWDTKPACPRLPAPGKQVISSFPIVAGFVSAEEEEEKRRQQV